MEGGQSLLYGVPCRAEWRSPCQSIHCNASPEQSLYCWPRHFVGAIPNRGAFVNRNAEQFWSAHQRERVWAAIFADNGARDGGLRIWRITPEFSARA